MSYTRQKKPIVQQVKGENFSSANLLFNDQNIFINDIIVASISPNVVTSGSTYTVSALDYYVIIRKASGSATTVNLPAPGNPGLTYIVKDGKGDAAIHNITVTPASGLVDGASSYVIKLAYQSNTFLDDGTNWNVI